ncbi:MAG: hypothetical protein KDA92_26685 [Planctomycetales bacterium]|nr:hypothetical protein [Planctomycetales bacterium]MCA9167196.1 hypothetical protein [Planctomycetales bacterium]
MKLKVTLRQTLVMTTLLAFAVWEPTRKARSICAACGVNRFDATVDLLPQRAREVIQQHNRSKQIEPMPTAGMAARVEPWTIADCLSLRRRVVLRPTGAWQRRAVTTPIPTGPMIPSLKLETTLFSISQIE